MKTTLEKERDFFSQLSKKNRIILILENSYYKKTENSKNGHNNLPSELFHQLEKILIGLQRTRPWSRKTDYPRVTDD